MADATKNVFDELFVISDLHLGGEEEPTLVAAGSEFKNWMNRTVLPRCGDQRHVGLVINGDMFDFLAERGARYFDPLAASSAVQRIAKDQRFQPVIAGLRKFLKRENTRLAITLGNHDLELCDRDVQQAVATVLGQANQANASPENRRINWALEADGYSCQVGNKRVLCRHGNEADPWNQVNREELKRRLAEAHNNPQTPAWIPNGGTQLVIDVVNPVREKWPFAQILKPEDARLLIILLCVDPSQRQRLRAFVKASGTRMGGLIGSMTRWLLAPTRKGRRSASRLDRQLLVEELVLATIPGETGFNSRDTARMLRDAHDQVDRTWREMESRRGLSTTTAGREEPSSRSERWHRRRQRLNTFDAAISIFKGGDRIEVLRNYLKRAMPDPELNPLDRTDDVYQHFRQQSLSNVDFVVTGHTHYRRAGLPLPRASRARYYNTGTWARMLTIPQEVIADSQRFIELFCLLQRAHNKELFADKQFVQSPCDYLHLHSDGTEVIAELKQAN